MSEKLTAEEALAQLGLTHSVHSNPLLIAEEYQKLLAEWGFILIPTDPASPEFEAMVEAGAKAIQPKAYALKTLNLWQQNAARKVARACTLAVLEELRKP